MPILTPSVLQSEQARLLYNRQLIPNGIKNIGILIFIYGHNVL